MTAVGAAPLSCGALRATLRDGGLPAPAIDDWIAAEPKAPGQFGADRRRYGIFWALAHALIEGLPRKSARKPDEAKAAEAIYERARASRASFLGAHAEEVYAALTNDFSRFIRVENLVFAAADAFPGLTPTRAEIERESGALQRDKDGLEIDQGLLLSHILGCERSGLHLCHAMLLPRPDTDEHLQRFIVEGAIDLGAVRVERRGVAAFLTTANPRYLNAEDETTLDKMEIAVDIAILDPATKVAVMRGREVDHPRYRGQRIFGAGINLTHLYRGKIAFVWYMRRDLGYVHKMFRGVARPDTLPDDVHGWGIEKPWIAAVDNFAIGGHCQALLVMDYVVAAADAYMTLPARKEGIIPGAANLRLPRFVGDRLARQLIQYERRLACDSPEGRLICDEIAPVAGIDASIDLIVAGLTTSGAVGAIANRRAFRVGAEPLDLFRRYMAVYGREQAYCHFSPALIANLERYWDAKNRSG
ncbi:MAG TPA: enoyl-CoA hydratase/isomerase family protein [Roseiarcus sp.]|nr:enoyl-CoA hydratase/isomerase family protein [Roseiarcus sp.]